jgi:hypothetical protein
VGRVGGVEAPAAGPLGGGGDPFAGDGASAEPGAAGEDGTGLVGPPEAVEGDAGVDAVGDGDAGADVPGEGVAEAA